MKTRRRKKPASGGLEYVPSEIGDGEQGGGPFGLVIPGRKLTFHDVDTAELLVIEDLEQEITRELIEGRFVKLAPRVLASERESFDGAAFVKVLRGYGARAVILAPIMVGEVRRVEPEQVVKRTPRETVKAWFDEQKTIDAPSRAAALELVFGFMDEESM